MRKTFYTLLISLFINQSFVQADTLIGKQLPVIKGKTVAGTVLEIPKDTTGKITLYSMGFSQASSKKSEVWFKNILSKYNTNKDMGFYALPMIGDNFLFKAVGPMMENSMRKKFKKEDQEHAMIVYENLEPIKKYINYNDKEDTYIYLTDKKGHIVWSAQGDFNTTKFNQLDDVIKAIKN